MGKKKNWLLSLLAIGFVVVVGYLFNTGIVWGDSEQSGDKYLTDIRTTDSTRGAAKEGDPVELNEVNKGEHTWTELDEKADGKTIKYTVKELGKIPLYTAFADTTTQGRTIITNANIPETTKIDGTKYWSDNKNQDGKRPESITIHLLADGERVDKQVVTGDQGADEWSYEFTDLPKYSNGKEIEYEVKEDTVVGYTSIYDTYGKYDIENQHTPGVTKMSVKKTWLDRENQDGIRPTSIEVQLYGDGKKSGDQIELNQGNNWRYTWKDLYQKSGGKDIIYKLEEVSKVPGYEKK